MTGIDRPQEGHAMPDSMIERVARAIEEAWDTTPERNLPPIEFTVEEIRHLARAAVKALREPTEAMQREGFRNNRHVNPTSCGKPTCVGAITLPPVKAYQAMIDAILAEGQPASPAPATEGGHGG